MATQRTGGTPEEKERAHWHADFGGTRGFPFSFPKHIQLAATAASADPSFGFTVAPYLCATALFHTSLVNVTRLGNVGIREASIIASHVVAETERASPAPCVAQLQNPAGGESGTRRGMQLTRASRTSAPRGPDCTARGPPP